MALFFLSEEHKQAFEKAIKKANITNKTIQTSLYLMTAIPQISQKLEEVFNFHGGYFYPDAIDKFNLSTGERILFALAINLYNGYQIEGVPLTPYSAIGYLDQMYKKVFLSALDYRFVS